MDVLSSRILPRPSDLDRSRRFYRDALGLAIYREFGPPDDPGVVFFPGPGLLEVSGHEAGPPGRSVRHRTYGRTRPDLARALEFYDRWLPNTLRRIADMTRACRPQCAMLRRSW